MNPGIDVRIYWDGELEPFADIIVEHPEAIPKVGDTIWLQWWKQSEADALDRDDDRPYPPIEPLTVLARGHNLWVRQGDRDLAVDDQEGILHRWTQSGDDLHAKLEVAVFVARVNKSKEAKP